MNITISREIWDFHALLHISCIYFTRSLRKQAASKQVTRGPTALSPFQGTRQ